MSTKPQTPHDVVCAALEDPAREWRLSEHALASGPMIVYVGTAGNEHIWKPHHVEPSWSERRRLRRAIAVAQANALKRLIAAPGAEP